MVDQSILASSPSRPIGENSVISFNNNRTPRLGIVLLAAVYSSEELNMKMITSCTSRVHGLLVLKQ